MSAGDFAARLRARGTLSVSRAKAADVTYVCLTTRERDALADLVDAVQTYEEAADWYRRCLEGVIDRTPIRGLAEARAAFDTARDKLLDALARLGGSAEGEGE